MQGSCMNLPCSQAYIIFMLSVGILWYFVVWPRFDVWFNPECTPQRINELNISYMFWHVHGGSSSDWCLLDCDIIYPYRLILKFRSKMPPPSSGLKWRQHAPPKRRCPNPEYHSLEYSDFNEWSYSVAPECKRSKMLFTTWRVLDSLPACLSVCLPVSLYVRLIDRGFMFSLLRVLI
jgi:hypothetical protein